MKLNSIQFLRAVAALLVVYNHSMDLQLKFGISIQQNFYYLKGFGCIGVDLFFVISGFIITYVANKYRGFTEGGYFLEKRFFRINPIYYLATILALVIYLIKLQINHTPVPYNVLSSLMDTILLFPTSSELFNFSPFLIIGWTLSFEWLFYLLFFFLIVCNVRQKLFALIIISITLIGIGQILKPEDLRLQFLTNPILLEFILGVMICQLYLRNKTIPTWIAATCLTMGIISYLLLLRFGYGDIWYYLKIINGETSLKKFILWGIPSAFILFGCVFLEKNRSLRRLFDNKLSMLLGNASYSIYLIHYIVFITLPMIFMPLGYFFPADLMIWLQIIVAVAISLMFYKWIELPMINKINKRINSKTNERNLPKTSYLAINQK